MDNIWKDTAMKFAVAKACRKSQTMQLDQKALRRRFQEKGITEFFNWSPALDLRSWRSEDEYAGGVFANKYVFMRIDMKLEKHEEKALLRVREQQNTRTKAQCSWEIADNCMESSEVSSAILDISDHPGPSSTYYQSLLRETKKLK
ncbi:hypothetical protein AVEN_271115-1 [Araneus ventricosus]|uniref:Uncharacterized protein n=1 Tax=Araneus ventricosus TaxID=182803 RepID=A0A4Y2E4B8_ARAVE|nr:hypothetical protein AVEN_271115-1 [Araneus ventricosus]